MTNQQQRILDELTSDASRTSQCIADIVGCHVKTVQRARTTHGYPGVSGTRVRAGSTVTYKQTLIIDAIKNNPSMSDRKIATLLNGTVNKSTVARVRAANGLERRS